MAKRSVKPPNKGDLRIPGFNAEAALYASPAMYRLSGRFVGGRSRRAELAFFKVAELFAAETPIVWSVAYAYGAADIRIRAASKARSRPGQTSLNARRQREMP
jgi:hypothetical protein